MSGDDFWSFPDLYRFKKRHSPQDKDESVDEYYSAALKTIRENSVFGEPNCQEFFTTHLALWTFARFHFPYCKIYPAMSLMLARTCIDIPTEHLQIPLPVFEIRFSRSTRFPLREGANTPPVRSIFVAHDLSHIPEALNFVPPKYREMGMEAFAPDGELFIYADFGEVWQNCPAYQRLFMTLQPGETIQDAFQRAAKYEKPHDLPGYYPGDEFRQSLLSVAISACFFMCHNHEYVAPDVHPRLIERYKRATKSSHPSHEVKSVLKQSQKLGYNGQTIGREIELPEPIVRYIDEQDPAGGRNWETRWSHVRSGHIRRQRVGPRADGKHKIIFIAPTLIRSDLPPSPVRKAYRIDDGPLFEDSKVPVE